MIVLGFVVFPAILCASATQGLHFRSNSGIENGPVLTTPQLANEWGYETEEHDAVSEDGYILRNFRVKRKNESVPLGAKVLLLLSGFITSSDYYLLMTETPFVLRLVDDGYDVWLGNVRGSRYGKRHKILSPSDVDFWDFSNQELGVYDIPAIIDYVLENTRSRKLGYVGYSQGATAFFVMMSERPEYNEKVALMFAFSPAVYFNHSDNIVLKFLALYGAHLFELARRSRFIELLSLDGPIFDALKHLCIDPILFPLVCRPLAWEVAGPKNSDQNDDSIRRTVKYLASGAMKTSVHYGQMLRSGKFRQYEYPTRAENLQKYGSAEPPEYNLENAKVPIVLITVADDVMVNYQDSEMLAEDLPNVLYFEKFPYGYYGHYSIISAENASQHLYKTLPLFLSQISFN